LPYLEGRVVAALKSGMRLPVGEAAKYCGLSLTQFRHQIRVGNIFPAVHGGKGRGKRDLFDVASLDALMDREPAKPGRPPGGLNANAPAVVERAIQQMAQEIQTWPYVSRSCLLSRTVDAGVVTNTDLRKFPSDPHEHTRALITALVIAEQIPLLAQSWPVLLVTVRRFQLAGASSARTVSWLEMTDEGLVRRFRAAWDDLAKSLPAPASAVTPIPISPRELEKITRGKERGWWFGRDTIRLMRRKDSAAVAASSERNATLNRDKWKEIRAHEVASYNDELGDEGQSDVVFGTVVSKQGGDGIDPMPRQRRSAVTEEDQAGRYSNRSLKYAAGRMDSAVAAEVGFYRGDREGLNEASQEAQRDIDLLLGVGAGEQGTKKREWWH